MKAHVVDNKGILRDLEFIKTNREEVGQICFSELLFTINKNNEVSFITRYFGCVGTNKKISIIIVKIDGAEYFYDKVNDKVFFEEKDLDRYIEKSFKVSLEV